MLKMKKEKENNDVVYYYAYPSGSEKAYYFSVNKKTGEIKLLDEPDELKENFGSMYRGHGVSMLYEMFRNNNFPDTKTRIWY